MIDKIFDTPITLTTKILYHKRKARNPRVIELPYYIFKESQILLLSTTSDVVYNYLEGCMKLQFPDEMDRLCEMYIQHYDVLETKVIELMYKFNIRGEPK